MLKPNVTYTNFCKNYCLHISSQVSSLSLSLTHTHTHTQVYSMTGLSGNETHPDSSRCVCVKSFTHYHEATSPAFLLKDYSSTRYSTWVESQ